MNLEEYEEQLAQEDKISLQDAKDKVLEHMKQHRQQIDNAMLQELEGRTDTAAYWGINIDPMIPTWQRREHLAQHIQEDPEVTRHHHLRNQRRSGRTTRMVFQALIAASEGKRVYIVAHNQTMSREIKRMVERAAGSMQHDTRLPEYVYNIRYLSDEAARMGRMHVDGNSIILYDNAIEDMRNGL